MKKLKVAVIAAGMALRNAVSSLQIFGFTNDIKCLNLSGDIRIYLGEIRHNNYINDINKIQILSLYITKKFPFSQALKSMY